MAVVRGVVEADGVSDAWLAGARRLAAAPGRTASHLVVRIGDPLHEDPHVRSELDRILDGLRLQSVATVANTLFPAALAERCPEPADLAEHYRTQTLPRLRRLARPKNSRGTYFGRLVAYPDGAGGTTDQLTATVEKLRRERGLPGPMSSCYELAVQAPEDDADTPPGDDHDPTSDVADSDRVERGGEPSGASALTYSALRDSKARMGFPCLSLLSFHLDGPELHLTAHYRNHHFVERAYGNYIGLGRLLAYVARATGVDPGELLVVSGHARLEHVKPLHDLLGGAQPLALDLEGPP